MNRSDLISALAGRFGQLTLADTELAAKTILEALNSALGAGSRIDIRGFGSFTVTQHAPRLGRNPKNGDSVLIPARQVLKFKPGKALRESVDQGLLNSTLPGTFSVIGEPWLNEINELRWFLC